MIKLALFDGLVLFGAVDRMVLMPRVAAPRAHVDAFAWTVPAEVMAGVVLLMAVAVLTCIAPI